MNPSSTSAETPDEQLNAQTIPSDAPFIHINLEKTKSFVLISPRSIVTKTEFERLRAWFEDQFFVVDEDGNEGSEDE